MIFFLQNPNIFRNFAYGKTSDMDEQERSYIKESGRRMELWEETPKAPSGRCSDKTEMEKEKLIDMLYAMVESRDGQIANLLEEIRLLREQSAEQHRDLKSRFDRMEQRAIAAETRADKAELALSESKAYAEEQNATIAALMDGSVLKDLEKKIALLTRQLADSKASDRQNRSERYGSKTQKIKSKEDKRHGEGRDNETNGSSESGHDRDAEREKDEMGGKDSVAKLPDEAKTESPEGQEDQWTAEHYNTERPWRQGKSNKKMHADQTIEYASDEDALPAGWKVKRDLWRESYEKLTKIIGYAVQFLICEDKDGNIHIVYQPKGDPQKRWVRDAKSVKDAVRQLKSGSILDDDGEPIVDCVPHTSASAGMMKDVTVDHFMNNIPFYRLSNYYKDNGFTQVRQTLINWVNRSAELMQPMIPALLDIAIDKDSVINCDETWCRVRVNGKYRKRYTWCLVNKEKKIVIYCYRKGARSRKALMDILDGRMPYAMQTDGYNVYLYLDDELIDCEHLCCMAHARAKFVKAWLANKEDDAKFIIDLIAKLYEFEDYYQKRRFEPDEIKQHRKNNETNEVIIKLRSKIDAMKAEGHPPRSELLDKAVSYLDSFWTQIMAYRNDGRYSIDNNIAERFMKPFANERKNSLFYGSDRMAHTSTIYHTLISTCIQMKASVSEYFGKLFAKIVRGCTDAVSMLPMNIGLTVKPC